MSEQEGPFARHPRGALSRRIDAQRRTFGVRTEQEKSVGVRVHRSDDGEPIRLKILPKVSGGFEVNWRNSGGRTETPPREVPLRVIDALSEKDAQARVYVLPIKDPQQTYYFEVRKPLPGAQVKSGEPVVYVKSLTKEEAEWATKPELRFEMLPAIAEQTQRLLATHDIVGVVGAGHDDAVFGPGKVTGKVRLQQGHS